MLSEAPALHGTVSAYLFLEQMGHLLATGPLHLLCILPECPPQSHPSGVTPPPPHFSVVLPHLFLSLAL